MAFKVKTYGNGALGDVTEISSTVNTSARVTALNATTITINNTSANPGLATFVTGAQVLIHVSAAVSASNKTYLGKWMIAEVTGVNSNVLTLDTDPTTLIPSAQLGNYYVQAIAIAQFKNLTLSEGTTISPIVYSTTNYHGGIVAIMCSEALTFDGGHISLTDRGIPVASKALRPTLTNYDVEADTGNYAGYENAGTADYFMLNAGDGAAFIIAKKLVCSEDSRIGNVSTQGAQFFRGHSSSVTYGDTKPTNVTNKGGSTILIAAEEIENFSTKMIAKYRSSSSTAGQGICRCYIASETKLRNDEGLYAYDCISTPGRIKNMHIKNFGNGSFGDITDSTTQLNNYATVTAIDGVKVTYKSATTVGLAQFSAGALVMVHFNHKTQTNVEHAGRFILATILANNGSVITLDTAPPNISPTDYSCQLVAIPQADNFTLSKENKATPAYNGEQGGIFAIAVKNACNLTNGKINVMQKGGGTAYGRPGLAFIGNAQDSDRLPIGQGHGSVFILANQLTMNANTRLGKTNTGAGAISYKYGNASGASNYGTGGYGGNSSSNNATFKWQGAHIFILAEKITGLRLAPLSTGGGNGGDVNARGPYGGYNAGGNNSGSAGWCFIYCNEVAEQDTNYIWFKN